MRHFIQYTDAPLECHQEFLRGPCEEGKHLLDISGNTRLLRRFPEGFSCMKHFCSASDQTRWSDGICYDEIVCDAEVYRDLSRNKLACSKDTLRQILDFPKVPH